MSEEFEPFGGVERAPEPRNPRREQMVIQWGAITAVCVALVLALVLTIVVTLPVVGLLQIDAEDQIGLITLSLPIQAAIFAGLAWFLIRGRISPDVLPRRGSTLFALGVGVVVGAVAYPVEYGVLWLLGQFGFEASEQSWVGVALEDPAIWLRMLPFIILIGPIAEEVFFRGYAFRLLLARVNVPVAYLLSSLLFAIVHLNPSGIPAYTLLALFVAWGYRRTGSLWTPVIAHIVHNAIVAITYSYLGVDG